MLVNLINFKGIAGEQVLNFVGGKGRKPRVCRYYNRTKGFDCRRLYGIILLYRNVAGSSLPKFFKHVVKFVFLIFLEVRKLEHFNYRSDILAVFLFLIPNVIEDGLQQKCFGVFPEGVSACFFVVCSGSRVFDDGVYQGLDILVVAFA